MSVSLFEHLSKGSFSFLKPDSRELGALFPHEARGVPVPQKIFLEDERATPLVGFPILLTKNLRILEELVVEYLEAEEESQLALQSRRSFDSKAYNTHWNRYRGALIQTTRNAIAAGHGKDLLSIFWLFHSLQISRHFRSIPGRIRRVDLEAGREHGDDIKYRIFFKWIDRVLTLTYDCAHELVDELEENEDTLFPQLLNRMRDNVLILTEDYISPDLTELSAYFTGCLNHDARDFRRRLTALASWVEQRLRHDQVLRSSVEDLLDEQLHDNGQQLLNRPHFVSFLSKYPGYDQERFLSTEQIALWNRLLTKIKEFETLHALRKMVVQVEVEAGAFVCRERSINSTWVAGPAVLRLSPATRPLDFTAPWVVNPVVHRYGLVYDISDFSATISQLGRAEKMAIDDAFRRTSIFQRKINGLAESLSLRLEKYLGDGAFFSGRHARNMVMAAISLQRCYRQAIDQGFPFDRGMRAALNYGEYRLLPLQGSSTTGESHYEFFGHGLVELSRLSSGKKSQEIAEFKTYLITQGYPEATVNKFFSPMVRKNAQLVSRLDESREFYAYINENNALINEGIVATKEFIERLGPFAELTYARDQGRGYISFELEEESIGTLRIGVRKIGVGHFKGLEPMPVYEVVDGARWTTTELKPVPNNRFMESLERVFLSMMSARHQKKQKSSTDKGIANDK